ncbi:MAG: CinA family protein, partial [Prevotella sp.]|nr:CinA family protein [Prevotella sp.]
MEFENRVLSREISQMLYEAGMTMGTAESCTGGRIAEAVIATPGASNYFKGSIVSYVDEIKVRLLHVDPQVIE